MSYQQGSILMDMENETKNNTDEVSVPVDEQKVFVEQKKPIGRPKKKLEDLAIEWNEKFKPLKWEEVITGLYAEGASDVEIRVRLAISEDLFYRLLNEEQEFSITIKKGREFCRVWWEEKARKSLENKEFNATLWYMNMKNRFGWKDRNDVTTNDKDISFSLLDLHDASKKTDKE